MPEPLHVAIVDDHPLFREGVAHTLGAQPDIEIVGEGESAADAVRIAAERMPDVMLLDVSMPGGGLQRGAGDRGRLPGDQGGDADRLRGRGRRHRGAARRRPRLRAEGRGGAGAGAHPARGGGRRGLRHPVAGGQPPLRADEREGNRLAAPSPLDDLTERERQILERVAGGDSNKEIGAQLFVSEKTVKHHMTNILQKLQVRNRVEAALMARAGEYPERR